MAEQFYSVKGILKADEVELGDLTRRGSSLTLTVQSRNGRIGTLIIGRGSITWKHRKRTKTLRWRQFNELMTREA